MNMNADTDSFFIQQPRHQPAVSAQARTVLAAELNALGACVEALDYLDPDTRARALRWLCDRYSHHLGPATSAAIATWADGHLPDLTSPLVHPAPTDPRQLRG